MIAVEARTITMTLETEEEPKFHYGQHLNLKQGRGRITGWEHIDEATQAKLDESEDNTTELGWHYTFTYDNPHWLQAPIQLFSETQLLDAIA